MKKKRLDLSGAEIIAIHDKTFNKNSSCTFCKLNYDINKNTEFGCLYHNTVAHMPTNWINEEIEVGMSELSDEAIRVQQKPIGSGVDIVDLVKIDLETRAVIGEKKYGERLKAFNGRDSLVDAYQEVLDLSVYLKQAIVEISSLKAENERLREALELFAEYAEIDTNDYYQIPKVKIEIAVKALEGSNEQKHG